MVLSKLTRRIGVGNFPRGAENGERIGRRAEADVPNHEFAGVLLERSRRRS